MWGSARSSSLADTDPTGVTETTNYGHDPLGQLTATSGTAGYTATPAGLLTQLGSDATLSYNSSQQVTTLNPTTDSNTTFSYDDDGQRTGATTGSSSKTYGYSAHGSLASFHGSASVSFQADGDNLRQSRTQGSSTRNFTWDTSAGLPLLLDDGDSSYVYGPNATPIAQIDDATGATSYLYGDNVGSVRLITDATGAVTRTASYDEYGAVVAHTGSGTSAIGYTGNWTDPTSGLVYLRARDYDPTTGQFLSVDPALARTHQPYSYTRNDPVNAVDLTGLCPVNGGANVADCTAADFGGNMFFLSPGALAIGDALNSPVGRAASSVLEGIGDGASFGLTTQLRQALGVDCEVERNGFYYGGLATGIAASTAAYGLGISAAAARIGNAGKLLDYATETAGSAAKGDYGALEVSAASGRTTLEDALRPEKLSHVFDPKHNLSPLVQQFGSREAAMEQITRNIGGPLPQSGGFQLVRYIGGQEVTIRGAVVNGIPRIGTAFTP